MNISLPKDLEDYVARQMQTGHYASVSEVIREALRNQIKLSASRQLDERLALGRQQVETGQVTVADEAYFDKAREYVEDQHMAHPTKT
ncbi:MAG: hypothetical protein GKR94_11080 [Gammaproteobacteria bacterium]|nr:hypothetical protein [Gammaproteobacteria bacterium]